MQPTDIVLVKTAVHLLGGALRNSNYLQVKRISVKLDGRLVGSKEGILIRKGFWKSRYLVQEESTIS